MEEDDQFALGLERGSAFFNLSDLPSRITTGPVPVNEWFSVVGVYDEPRKNIRIYLNGELEASKRLAASIRNTSMPLYIGRGEISRLAFQGDLDEVRIYNRALTDEEIRTLYEGPSFEERTKSVAAMQQPAMSEPALDPVVEIEKEIQEHYAKAVPEVQEYVRWTAKTFTRGDLWRAAGAFDRLSPEEREKKVNYLVEALNGEYGRHLCGPLADAGAIKDKRLLPGLTKAANYHRENGDYDCRPKWMAVAALGRQDDESAVPTLVPLIDHGNQNVRMWAQAGLARLTGQSFGTDKQAWGKWWNESGHQPPIDLSQLKPWTPPPSPGVAAPAGPPAGTGPTGRILRFDGMDDFIHIPSAPHLDLTENFSVSAWVRVEPGCGEAPIYKRGDKQIAHDPCQLFVIDGKMAFRIDGGAGTNADVAWTGVPLDTGWHLWTGVCDSAAGKMRLYKDGQLAADHPAPPPFQYPTSGMYSEIGAIDAGAWGGTWGFFKGDIDQLSIWNVARQPEDIQRELNQGLKGDEPGLIALWKFDEDGQTVVDSSPLKYDLTLGRSPEPDASDPVRLDYQAAMAASQEQVKSAAGVELPAVPDPGLEPAAAIEREILEHYVKADTEVQDFVRWTAARFGPAGFWRPADAFAQLSPEERDQKVNYLVEALNGEYGRHLCGPLADAGAIKDKRLLPGLTKAANYHRDDSDYDCRPKWIAIASLGRQDDESAVPTLVPLVDHGNKNVRMWAQASLVRLTGQNFSGDKQAWGKWWNESGRQPPIDLSQLKPWTPPLSPGVAAPAATAPTGVGKERE